MKSVFLTKFTILALFSGAFGVPPLSTEDATVSGSPSFSSEIVSAFSIHKNSHLCQNFLFIPSFGINGQTDVFVEVPYCFNTSANQPLNQGFEEVSLVLKNLILEESKDFPAALLKVSAKMSFFNHTNHSKGADQDFGFVVAGTRTFSNFTLHGNLGYTFVGNKTDPLLKDFAILGMAFEYPFLKNLTLLGELYGEVHQTPSGFSADQNLGLGLGYTGFSNLSLSIGVNLGHPRNQEYLGGVLFGVSWSG